MTVSDNDDNDENDHENTEDDLKYKFLQFNFVRIVFDANFAFPESTRSSS